MGILRYSKTGEIREYDWDDAKNAINEDKHGISFRDAMELWDDEHRLVTVVKRGGEVRKFAISRWRGSYWAVVYAERGWKVRIISARRASRKEVSSYDKAYQ